MATYLAGCDAVSSPDLIGDFKKVGDGGKRTRPQEDEATAGWPGQTASSRSSRAIAATNVGAEWCFRLPKLRSITRAQESKNRSVVTTTVWFCRCGSRVSRRKASPMRIIPATSTSSIGPWSSMIQFHSVRRGVRFTSTKAAVSNELHRVPGGMTAMALWRISSISMLTDMRPTAFEVDICRPVRLRH